MHAACPCAHITALEVLRPVPPSPGLGSQGQFSVSSGWERAGQMPQEHVRRSHFLQFGVELRVLGNLSFTSLCM